MYRGAVKARISCSGDVKWRWIQRSSGRSWLLGGSDGAIVCRTGAKRSGQLCSRTVLSAPLGEKMRWKRDGGAKAQCFGIVWVQFVHWLFIVIVLVILPTIRSALVNKFRFGRHSSTIDPKASVTTDSTTISWLPLRLIFFGWRIVPEKERFGIFLDRGGLVKRLRCHRRRWCHEVLILGGCRTEARL